MPKVNNVYVIGPGERGMELIYPVAVVSNLTDARAFVKKRWNVELTPMEDKPNMWSGRRERENPVDLIFVYRLPLGAS